METHKIALGFKSVVDVEDGGLVDALTSICWDVLPRDKQSSLFFHPPLLLLTDAVDDILLILGL
jgi:hypothetical protein